MLPGRRVLGVGGHREVRVSVAVEVAADLAPAELVASLYRAGDPGAVLRIRRAAGAGHTTAVAVEDMEHARVGVRSHVLQRRSDDHIGIAIIVHIVRERLYSHRRLLRIRRLVYAVTVVFKGVYIAPSHGWLVGEGKGSIRCQRCPRQRVGPVPIRPRHTYGLAKRRRWQDSTGTGDRCAETGDKPGEGHGHRCCSLVRVRQHVERCLSVKASGEDK